MNFKKFLTTFPLYNFTFENKENSRVFSGYNLNDYFRDQKLLKIEENTVLTHGGSELTRKDGKDWEMKDKTLIASLYTSCYTSHVDRKENRENNHIHFSTRDYGGIANIIVKNATYAVLSSNHSDSLNIDLEKKDDDFVLPGATLENPLLFPPCACSLIILTDGDVYYDSIHICSNDTHVIAKLIRSHFVLFSMFGNYIIMYPELIPIFCKNKTKFYKVFTKEEAEEINSQFIRSSKEFREKMEAELWKNYFVNF